MADIINTSETPDITEGDIAVVVTVIISHRELFCVTIFDK